MKKLIATVSMVLLLSVSSSGFAADNVSSEKQKQSLEVIDDNASAYIKKFNYLASIESYCYFNRKVE